MAVLGTAALSALSCQLIAGDFTIGPVSSALEPLGTFCAPDETRCNGGVLETCAANRTEFVAVEDCGSPEACDALGPGCGGCVPGEFTCNGASLLQCGPAGAWQPAEDCATAALCHVSADRRTGSCEMPICEPGVHGCEVGDRLVRCAAAQTHWELVEHCSADTPCDAALADAQAAAGEPVHCVSPCADSGECPSCEPGSMRCAPGAFPDLEYCNAAGTWVLRQSCSTSALCDAAAGRCLPAACNSGETRCRGQLFEQCKDDLTRFEELATCADGELCDPVDGCVPGPCTQGAFRCNGARLERCEGGVFVPEQVCATAALCDPAGRCTEPECAPHHSECQGQILLRCTPERDAIDDFATCGEDETCNKYPDFASPRPACDPLP